VRRPAPSAFAPLAHAAVALDGTRICAQVRRNGPWCVFGAWPEAPRGFAALGGLLWRLCYLKPMLSRSGCGRTRRLDQLRQAQKETVGFNKGGGDQKSDHRVFKKPGDPPTLAEAGIDKNLAHQRRQLGALAEEVMARTTASHAPVAPIFPYLWQAPRSLEPWWHRMPPARLSASCVCGGPVMVRALARGARGLSRGLPQ
jgi:hypothetical protein